MNVIIEPLSEQAWMRVETRLLRRLPNGSSEGSAPERSRPLPWAREVALAVTSMRCRLRSRWDELRSDYEVRRGVTARASESGIFMRPTPQRDDGSGSAPSMSSQRTF